MKSKPPSAFTAVQTAESRPLANYSYETVNLIKRKVRDTRTELDRQQQTANTCEAHARSLCEQVDLGEACYAKVSNNCLNSFGVSNEGQSSEFDMYLIHVSFELLENPSRKARFQSVPTKLELPQEDIEMLIDVAPELLHKNPEFNHLLKDLDALIAE